MSVQRYAVQLVAVKLLLRPPPHQLPPSPGRSGQARAGLMPFMAWLPLQLKMTLCTVVETPVGLQQLPPLYYTLAAQVAACSLH